MTSNYVILSIMSFLEIKNDKYITIKVDATSSGCIAKTKSVFFLNDIK